jgi:NitT/TauT family transport system permease protein
VPCSLLAGWEAGVRAGVVDAIFFPPPSALAARAAELVAQGLLPRACAHSVWRTLCALVPGAGLGILAGTAMGASDGVRRLFEPSFAALYSMPKLALLPVFLLILGVGEPARLALVALGVFLLMTMQVFDAARSLDAGHLEMARLYGASPWQLWRRVYGPACLPQIFTGLRLSFGRAFVMSISVELVTGAPGLGSLIWMAWQSFSPDRLYVAVLTAAALGYAAQTFLRRLERRAVPWKDRA